MAARVVMLIYQRVTMGIVFRQQDLRGETLRNEEDRCSDFVDPSMWTTAPRAFVLRIAF
jgi:hypothetical protein